MNLQPFDPSGTARLRDTVRLRECLAADFARLRAVAGAADLAAMVPSCPEWSVADLLTHVATVYLHKVECMRLGKKPEHWPPDEIAGAEPLALLDRAYGELMVEFGQREPGSGTFTWFGPEQTVGFWIRRMAQETVIHRVDVELAAGVEVTPIASDLALDGIDEMLVVFLEYAARAWPESFQAELAQADGRATLIRTADTAWLVRPLPAEIQVRPAELDSGAAALVSGEPAAMLLWLWNRAGDDAVSISGDSEAVATLRRALTAGAQ